MEVDEDSHTVHARVEADQLSLAIGKKGQNARLTARLTGWKVDVQKDEGDISFEEKLEQATSSLAAVKGIGRDSAERLVQSGFLTLEGILAAEASDLADATGWDEGTALAVRNAAAAAFEAANGKPEE
jgi:N utilization substance protein A